jgi:glycosyltransferase involved in cell wall biosynthesis
MNVHGSPLRIALICDWFHPRVGGIEVHLRGLAEGLAQAGHEPHVITATPGPADDYGFPVHRLDAPITGRFGFVHTPGPFIQVHGLLRRYAFDVVHGHSSILSPLTYGSLYLAQRQGFPAVMTCHSILEYYWVLFWLADRLSGWSRFPILFSAVSPTAAGYLKKGGRMDGIPILPNAVNANGWRLPEVPKDPAEIRLVSVMRLSIRKRAHTLIRLLPEILRQCPPGRRLRLTIVGDGNQKPRLAKLVQRLGLQEVVDFPGILDQPAIAALFARSDIFVLPTNQEAFGLAALEARTAGLPVVGMARSALSHLIRHGTEGLLASDDGELRRHLLSLILDDGTRRRIAAHNRTTETGWTWESAISNHLELYAQARRERNRHDARQAGNSPGGKR